MKSVPSRIVILVLTLAGVAVATLAAAVAREPVHPDYSQALLMALLSAMVLLARLYPVHLAPKTKTAVDTAPLFAAALLLPAPLAMVVAAAAVGVANPVRHAPWYQTVFNTAEVALRVAVGGALFGLFSSSDRLTDLALGRWLPAAAVAAVAMYLVNGVLVDLVVGVQLRRSPLADFWRRRRFDLPQEGALFLLGLLVAALGARYPWTIVLLAVPVFVVHRSLRDGVALRAQTREALEELADIVDMRDHYTFEHSRRVAALARATADALGMAADEAEVVEMAGRVHDVGKIGIKSTVLMNPDGLNDSQWAEMRSHPEVGARLVAKFPQFARGRELILSHHERYDGTGYPRRLAGDRIPLGGRVLAVADAWDAMTSHRAYRRALDLAQVYAELERGRGTQFDPVVLDAFLKVLRDRPELAAYHTDIVQDIDRPFTQPSVA